ncbi:MAG: GGDEF domain-containing protein, partial [Sphingomicrobium sp.]
MTAAAPRSAAPDGAYAAVTLGTSTARSGAGDIALLDALPIAAAVVGMSGKRLALVAANRRFHESLTLSGDPGEARGQLALFKGGPVADLLHAFLADPGKANGELDLKDGDGVSARHFRIKLAPLAKARDGSSRCLLSVVDRTVEVQTERNLRAEMLRDSLTGLPNRLSFAESIEDRLESGAAAASHAVLVVDMLRFSRINESMGSLAGDELLIT